MILEVPTPDDYLRASTYALNLAWDVATELGDRLRRAVEQGGFTEEEVAETYWQRAQQPLANAMGLILQGFEFALKSRIADVSPYLLLLTNTPDRLPKATRSGIPFSDFRTIDTKDLVKVHDLFSPRPIPSEFGSLFETTRRLRNQFIHGILKGVELSESRIYESILMGQHFLWGGKASWATVRREYLESRTSQAVVDELQMSFGQLLLEFDRMVDLVPRSCLKVVLNFDKKVRRYICPAACYREMSSSDFRDCMAPEPVRLAQLVPNDPTSTTLFCCVCGATSTVTRRKCTFCRGDVLSTAMTHWGERSEGLLCLSCEHRCPAE